MVIDQKLEIYKEQKEINSVKFIDFLKMAKEGGTYQIETPDGWQNIGDIYIKRNRKKIKLSFSNDREISVSEDHLFEVYTNLYNESDSIFDRVEFLDGSVWIRSKNILVGDNIISKNGYSTVSSIEHLGIGDTYDLEVEHTNHRYWSDDFSSHNTGKSSIAEGLALKIKERDVSRVLFNKRVVMLDLASLVAGTKYRGQFEERIKALMGEVENNRDIILFIDEIHTIIGAGSTSGSLDASNMFKPALARGEIQIIGATTLDEYRKYIEKDGALERRFQKVVVEPSTAEETIEILSNIKDKYEAHHRVIYTEKALEACVDLTNRYMADRHLPDKAIDALDEAGARVHISNIVVPKKITDIESKITNIKKEKNEVIRSQKYEEAAKLRDKERKLIDELEKEREKWEKDSKNNRQVVNESDVAMVVSMMTGIPVTKVGQKENDKLSKMFDVISKNVIGQDDAVKKVVKAIQRSRVGMKEANKPVFSGILIGNSGVGKCVGRNTLVTIRNKKTGNIEKVRIDSLINKD